MSSRAAWRWGAGLAVATATAALGIVLFTGAIDRYYGRVLKWMPPAPSVSLMALLFDQTPVTVRTTISWQRFLLTLTTDRLLNDHTVWRHMFLNDWDQVTNPPRDAVLDRIWKEYREYVLTPSRWDQMSPDDWDDVPQPNRAMAYVEMIRYWSGFYLVLAKDQNAMAERNDLLDLGGEHHQRHALAGEVAKHAV
jgi:hypothetical protein